MAQNRKKADLDHLPRNAHDKLLSRCVLVASTKLASLDTVLVLYFDFKDGYFHFPSYGGVEGKDVKLIPISEIDRWTELPAKPV